MGKKAKTSVLRRWKGRQTGSSRARESRATIRGGAEKRTSLRIYQGPARPSRMDLGRANPAALMEPEYLERRIRELLRPLGPSISPVTSALLNPDALSEDQTGGDPAVDASFVISDLESRPLHRLDQMQVLRSVHFAENDVPVGRISLVGMTFCSTRDYRKSSIRLCPTSGSAVVYNRTLLAGCCAFSIGCERVPMRGRNSDVTRQ